MVARDHGRRLRLPLENDRQSMELADRLVNFLGMQEDDADFQEFLTEFKQFLHSQKSEKRHRQYYEFAQLGITIYASQNWIMSLAFHIGTRSVRDGDYQAFKGILPYGIHSADTRVVVSEKLGVPPTKSTPVDAVFTPSSDSCNEHQTWWDHYNLSPLEFTLIFASPYAELEMISISHIPTFQKMSRESRHLRSS